MEHSKIVKKAITKTLTDILCIIMGFLLVIGITFAAVYLFGNIPIWIAVALGYAVEDLTDVVYFYELVAILGIVMISLYVYLLYHKNLEEIAEKYSRVEVKTEKSKTENKA